MVTEDTCHKDTCENPLPFDMPSIFIDSDLYCSPECATEALDSITQTPSRVGARDPQYQVDRDTLPNVAEDEISIHREVTDAADARAAVVELAEMFNGPFRVDIETQ